MTDKQRTVIWLGMILVVLNLTTKWSQVRSVVFGGTTTTAASTTPTTTPPKTTPTAVQVV